MQDLINMLIGILVILLTLGIAYGILVFYRKTIAPKLELRVREYEPIIGVLLLLFIGIWAFVHYDGMGHIQKIWDNLSPLKSKASVTDEKLIKDASENKILNKDCTKAWSVSQQKFIEVCKKSRSEILADCSKSSGKSLAEFSNSNMTIDKIEKTRELLMKVCMQNAGFDY